MGGLMNSIGRGLSAAGYAGADIYAKGALADQQAGIASKLEEQRAAIVRERDLRLEEAGIRTENRAAAKVDQQRTDQVARVDDAAGKIADTAIEGKRGLINSRITDKESWTPEQQAAVDQSLAIDRGTAKADPKTRTQAAINTGDITPKDAATLTQKDDAALYKAMWEQSKEDGRNQRADDRIAASAEASDKRLGYLFAALEKRGSKDGKADTNKEALQFMEGSRKEVQSEAANLKALYAADLKDVSSSKQAAIKAEYDPKFKAIEAKRTQIDADYDFLRDKIGLPPRGAPTGQPAPAGKPEAAKPSAGLPQGAKQIGTSGGKPVYETPDGKRFVQN